MNSTEDIKAHPWFVDIDWIKMYNKQVSPPFRPSVKDVMDLRYVEGGKKREEGRGKRERTSRPILGLLTLIGSRCSTKERRKGKKIAYFRKKKPTEQLARNNFSEHVTRNNFSASLTIIRYFDKKVLAQDPKKLDFRLKHRQRLDVDKHAFDDFSFEREPTPPKMYVGGRRERERRGGRGRERERKGEEGRGRHQ
jgi:hypothetical protein